MSLSPAMKHRALVEAQKSASSDDNGDIPVNQQLYRAFTIKLRSDLARLAKIPSKIERNRIKGELIAEYEDFLEPLLKAGITGQHNHVFARLLIWCVDAGHYDRALELLAVAMANDLSTPSQFSARKLPEIIVEDIAMAVIHSPEPDQLLDMLERLEALVRDISLPDYVKAKLFKALGLASMNQDDEKSLNWFQQAFTYNPKGGVKSHINRLEKRKQVASSPIKRHRKVSPKCTGEEVKHYDLSVRQAAALMGVSPQKFNKIAEANHFSYYPVPYGKGIMKRYKTTEVKAYISRNIVKKDTVMNIKMIQRSGLEQTVITSLLADASQVLKVLPVQGDDNTQRLKNNFVSFWLYNQLRQFTMDYANLTGVEDLEAIQTAIRNPKPIGLPHQDDDFIRSFEEFFPEGLGEQYRDYLADKLQVILMDKELLPHDSLVFKRAMTFESTGKVF